MLSTTHLLLIALLQTAHGGFTPANKTELETALLNGGCYTNASCVSDDDTHISDWDTSLVDDMSSLFFGKNDFNADISQWNVGQVTTMFRMFLGATVFDQDIGGWDVSKVTTMDIMFYQATTFNGDISGWDVSNVESMV